MTSISDQARSLWARWRCCPAPAMVTGVTAEAGGGSGEVVVSWDRLPASEDVAFYRVYERKSTGLWWHLAVVTNDAFGLQAPGRFAIVDAADYWPWPTGGTAPGARCFVVTAVSTHGLEGPM